MRGFVTLPRLAHPSAVAVASGGVSDDVLLWTSAPLARSSSNVTSLPLDGCAIGLPFSSVECPFALSRNGLGPALAAVPVRTTPKMSALVVMNAARRRLRCIAPPCAGLGPVPGMVSGRAAEGHDVRAVARRSDAQARPDRSLHQFWIRESTVAGHRVHEVVTDAHVERPVDERDELDCGQLLAEFDHERAREGGRLVLVTTLGAVRDPDADR